MDTLIQFLIDHGAGGMFWAALLSGSIFPCSSEVVMVALYEMGVNAALLLFYGTAGNVLGSMLNYGVGRLGREEWIERFLKVSPKKLERGKKYVRRYGCWAGVLAWLPVIGELVTVAMGYMRVNPLYSLLIIGAAKFLRYYAIMYAVMAVYPQEASAFLTANREWITQVFQF